MSRDEVATRGAWGVVEWVKLRNGTCPAREFLESREVSDDERARCWAFINRLANLGNRLSIQEDKFKKLGKRAPKGAQDKWEMKPTSQIRFIGDFRPGARFLIAVGLRKKKDDLRPEDMLRAVRYLDQDQP